MAERRQADAANTAGWVGAYAYFHAFAAAEPEPRCRDRVGSIRVGRSPVVGRRNETTRSDAVQHPALQPYGLRQARSKVQLSIDGQYRHERADSGPIRGRRGVGNPGACLAATPHTRICLPRRSLQRQPSSHCQLPRRRGPLRLRRRGCAPDAVELQRKPDTRGRRRSQDPPG